MPEIDIITGEKRFRRWTEEEKLSILAAAFAPGAVTAQVAKRANISTGQLYTWRKQFMKPKTDGCRGFAPVVAVANTPPALPAPETPAPAALPMMAAPGELPAIEIETKGGKARIPPAMPAALAAAVIRAMVRA